LSMNRSVQPLLARRVRLAQRKELFEHHLGGHPDELHQFGVGLFVRLVRVGIVADAERLTFSVRDRGTFVMPVLDGSMSAEHGRGLALMASLVDEVQLEIEPGGTTVRLSKART
jgi:hypothetical protein